MDYELLLGDYTEIEEWILEGRVDCGFLRLPTQKELKTIFLEQNKLMAVIPEDHPLADCEKFPAASRLCCWKREQKLRYPRYLREII